MCCCYDPQSLYLALDGSVLDLERLSKWGSNILVSMDALELHYQTVSDLFPYYLFHPILFLPLFSFPLFLGPLITPINVRGEVLGQVSPSSQSPSTPPKTQSLMISAG